MRRSALPPWTPGNRQHPLRNFADVYLLSRRRDIDGSELASAVEEVAAYRAVPVAPLRVVLDGYAAIA
jgi:hypothetical protein